MARDGHGLKAVESKEPNELYDSLSQDGKDIWDEIGSLGYKPEKGFKGLFYARKNSGDAKDAIGPSESLSVLLTMVKEEVAKRPDSDPDSESEEASSDLDEMPPSDRLPGMEEPAIEDLDRMGDNCISLKEKRDKAKTEFDDACDIMRQKMKQYERKRYNRRGFSLVVEESEKLVIKKAEQAKTNKRSGKKSPGDVPLAA
jgi:hypothetical protein